MSILERKLNILFDADPAPGGDPKTPDPKTPDPKVPDPAPKDPDPKTVPYDRFKEVNDGKTAAEKELQKIKDAQTKASEDSLKEQNKWKELFEKRDAEAKVKETENLRLRVATKKGLPADLIDRLKGETEQELEADAEKLLEFVKPGSPGNPPHNRGGGTTRLDINSMSVDEIRKNSEALFNQGNAKKD